VTQAQAQTGRPNGPQPVRGTHGGTILGPTNPVIEAQNPDTLVPPRTDAGTMPNLKWSFADSHMRLDEGGWSRQTTQRELGIATEIAAVNMRLEAGAIRELHWHRPSEWGYVTAGRARVTAVDQQGRAFQDDLGEGDLWFFPGGVPHSIQGLAGDGCEFLLLFDDGNFDENATFLLTDFLAHTPKDVLAKNLGTSESALAKIPEHELYIFRSKLPGPLAADRIVGNGPMPAPLTHRMLAQTPLRTKGGSVRITDSSVFHASKTIAAALVEVEPGGLRELHWHPNADEWAYYLSGQGRMTVFGAQGNAFTFDYRAGDVGYVPRSMPHYVENTGTTTLRFLEAFRSDHYEQVSLAQWLALTPHELVRAHLHLDESILAKLPIASTPVLPP
jgi:oxalate decarboxylase